MMFEASSMLRSVQQILLMPVAEKRNQQALWVTWATLFAGALTSAILFKMTNFKITLMVASSFVFATAMVWWMIFIGCTQRQCTQTNSQLVPGLPQKIRVVAASLWLTGSLWLALLVASQAGIFVFWWFSISLGMCLWVWFSRFPLITTLITITFTIFLSEKINFNYFESGTNTYVATILATLTFAAFTFAKILLPRKPRSGHEQRHKSEPLAKAKELIYQLLLPSIINSLSGSRVYLWFLKRALRTQASPAQLLSYMFGPQGHWSKTAIFSVFMISLITLSWLFGTGESNPHPNFFMYLTALIVFYGSNGFTPRNWLLTRREQNLLLLAPKSPQGRNLNKSMGNIIVSSHNAQFTQAAILFVAYFLTNITLKNVDRFQIIAGIETLLTAYLFVLGLQFRSFAHMKNKPDFDWAAIMKTVILVILTLAPVVLISIFFDITATCIVLLAYILGGITFLIWRRQRMLDGPAALPAGRLAND